MKTLLLGLAALTLAACANTGPDGVTHTATSTSEFPNGTVIENEQDAGVAVPALALALFLL